MDLKDAVIAELQDKLKRQTEEMYAVMRNTHEGLMARSHLEIRQLQAELSQEKARTQRKDQIITELGQFEQKLSAAVAANLQLQNQLAEANAKIAAYEKAERKANKFNKVKDKEN